MRTLIFWLALFFAVTESLSAQSYILNQFKVTPNETGAVIELRLNPGRRVGLSDPASREVAGSGPLR